VSGVDVSSVALDMTSFATFTATGNGRAWIAQRGKAKQKRSDLRLVGLGLGIEETVLTYPSTGGRPKARRMTTELTGHQPRLHKTFGLARWAPRS
jgi:hypothetical protein